MTYEPVIGLNLNLPLSTAKAVLGFLEKLEAPVVPVQRAIDLAESRGDVAARLMHGDKAAALVREFVRQEGVLLNKELATALGIGSKPQLTFKALATITLRLRKIGVDDSDWYTRDRVNGGTRLRLRPDVLALFKRAADEMNRLSQTAESLSSEDQGVEK